MQWITVRTAFFLLTAVLPFLHGCRTQGGTDSSGAGYVSHDGSEQLSVSPAEVEFMSLAHILIVPDELDPEGPEEALAAIEEARELIISGESCFGAVAAERSQCTSSSDSGRLPDVTPGALTEELDRAASVLAAGEVSGIIRTRFGYHLLRRLED